MKGGAWQAVADIPGAYLRTDIYEFLVMMSIEALAEILASIDLTLYCKYLIIGKNINPILYVKLHKALNVYIRVYLLFCENLSKVLEWVGFNLIPYDPCVENKMISIQ